MEGCTYSDGGVYILRLHKEGVPGCTREVYPETKKVEKQGIPENLGGEAQAAGPYRAERGGTRSSEAGPGRAELEGAGGAEPRADGHDKAACRPGHDSRLDSKPGHHQAEDGPASLDEAAIRPDQKATNGPDEEAASGPEALEQYLAERSRFIPRWTGRLRCKDLDCGARVDRIASGYLLGQLVGRHDNWVMSTAWLCRGNAVASASFDMDLLIRPVPPKFVHHLSRPTAPP